MTDARVDLIYGFSADEALGDQQFLARWRNLYDKCPYATAYQAPGFVRTWYGTYRAEWQPVIVRSIDADGSFIGLWLLAHDPTTSSLSHAGTHQAEYHTWLAMPGSEVIFLAAAWAKLKENIAFSKLQFKYLPAPELGVILQSALGPKNRVAAHLRSRPLLVLNSECIRADLAKKNNRYTLNALKKLGAYEFRRLVTPKDLDRIFGDLIAYYDFRQGAVNHSCPFMEDPHKRQFHTDLFVGAPEEIYVTVAYLNGRPISAFWGAVSRKMAHIAMLVHSPFLAKYSPGRIHILQLAEQLQRAGLQVLDLTPGGDAWKEGFANAHDQVAEAVIYRSRWMSIWAETTSALLRWGKLCATRVGLRPDTMKLALLATNRIRPAAAYRKTRAWLGVSRDLRIYRADRRLAGQYSSDARVHCNSLRDLLCFEPAESWQTRDDFLSSSYTRLEHGEAVYTVCIDDRLAHHAWMVAGLARSFLSEVHQAVAFPPGSVTFYDCYSGPEYRGRGLYRATLGHMLAAAFSDESIQQAYIAELSDNSASRHVIETMGFTYVGSIYWQSRFGRERKGAGPTLAQSELQISD